MNVNDLYKYSRGYIYLPLVLDKDGLHEDLTLFGEKYFLKSEFHVSIVCVKNILKQHPQIKESNIIELFNKFVGTTSLNNVSYLNEYRIATHVNGRKSIIQKVDISGIEVFYNMLRGDLFIEIDTQPVHVTIYTNRKDLGIGINTEDEYQKTTEIRFR